MEMGVSKNPKQIKIYWHQIIPVHHSPVSSIQNPNVLPSERIFKVKISP